MKEDEYLSQCIIIFIANNEDDILAVSTMSIVYQASCQVFGTGSEQEVTSDKNNYGGQTVLKCRYILAI